MMKENLIQVICGPGKGKTASALGRGVTDAAINFFEKNANPSERFRKTLQRVGEGDKESAGAL